MVQQSYACIWTNFLNFLNVRNQYERIRKKKDSLLPSEEFLPYIQNWKSSITKSEGSFLKKDRNKMFLSHQTYEGLQIAVLSVIETIRYLLKNGMSFVLTENLNQDCVEDNFGLGRRNENPSLFQFGYDSNTIRMQRSIVHVTGNTRGGCKEKRHVSWETVDETPLQKRHFREKLYK